MKPACGKSGCKFCDPNGPSLRQLAVYIVPLEDDKRVVTLKQWSWRGTKPKDRVTEKEILHRLVWHRGFVDAFFSCDSHLESSGPYEPAKEWHGPFFRADIRPQDFAPLEKGEARRALEEFLARPQYRPPSPWAIKRLDVLRPLIDLDGSQAFVLRMPEGARHHELGSLCSAPGYFLSELVLIETVRRLVSTLVLFIDE